MITGTECPHTSYSKHIFGTYMHGAPSLSLVIAWSTDQANAAAAHQHANANAAPDPARETFPARITSAVR